MKSRFAVALASFALLTTASVAYADTLSYLTSSDTAQLGRPSRSGTPQMWPATPGGSQPESDTGQINTTTTYYYREYKVSAADLNGKNYVEVSVDDKGGSSAFFLSAFANSYDPLNRGTNWLGDEGSSGNIIFYSGQSGDPRSFQVYLPTNADLILLVNSTLGGTNGLGTAGTFDIVVNAYADNGYNDSNPDYDLALTQVPIKSPAVTPEPGTIVTTLTGLLGALGAARRRYARSNA